MASQLTNPLLYQTREGSLEDPYVDKVESVKPVNGRAVLEEVPVKEFGVIVDNYIEKATNTPKGIEFYVDYTNGVLYFEPTLDATVTVRYKGRGVVLIPAERIYYGDAETNETLDVSLTSLQSLAGTYEEEIQLTNEATGLATQATAFAQEQGEYALAQGDYAKALGLEAKGNAEAAVGSALAARDEALEKAQLADEAARTVKVDWLDPVQTFADLATTYPNPTETNQVQVLDTGYIYRFKNGLWDTHLFSPVHPSELARHTDRFIATQSQTVFDTSKPYFTNQDRIDVYVSGVKQASGIDFNETSPTRITLTTGCEAGEIVETVYLKTTEAQALDLIEQVQAAEAATTAANTAKDEALSAATSTKLIWKDPVANFAALATTYPTATDGWTAATKDDGKIYRKNGSEWKLIQEVDLTAYNALDTKVTAQLAETVKGKEVVTNAQTDGKNTTFGHASNKIADDVSTSVILGGGSTGYNNVIGGDGANVNTVNPNTTTTGTGAHVSVVGGYDNSAGSLSSKIISDHSKTEVGGNGHNAIYGGANHVIKNTASFAMIAGGQTNEVSGYGGFATGLRNKIGGQGSAGFGYDNIITANGAFANGAANTVSGLFAQGYGSTNTAAANFSKAEGNYAHTRTVGQQAVATGRFAALGDAQTSVIEMYKQTTDAITTTLGMLQSTTSHKLVENQSVAFVALLVARAVGGTDSAAWEIKGLAKRGATGNTTFVGTPIITSLGADTGASTWTVAMAGDSAGGLNVRITGEAGKTIRWVQRMTLSEVMV